MAGNEYVKHSVTLAINNTAIFNKTSSDLKKIKRARPMVDFLLHTGPIIEE